jgi:hypothetical protein
MEVGSITASAKVEQYAQLAVDKKNEWLSDIELESEPDGSEIYSEIESDIDDFIDKFVKPSDRILIEEMYLSLLIEKIVDLLAEDSKDEKNSKRFF